MVPDVLVPMSFLVKDNYERQTNGFGWRGSKAGTIEYLSLETNKPVFEVLYTLSFTRVMKPSEFNTNMMQTDLSDLNMYEIFVHHRLWILLIPI
jgi:CHASE1-domain containing sensor protein